MLFSNEQIAQVCHEINRIYCQSIGDASQAVWAAAPDWQKDSAIAGVQAIRSGRTTQPSDSHESWLAQKKADGWKYGPAKNPESKEHPCFLPYEQLPAREQMKDFLFFNLAVLLLGMDPQADGLPALPFRNLRALVGLLDALRVTIEKQEATLQQMSAALVQRQQETSSGLHAAADAMVGGGAAVESAAESEVVRYDFVYLDPAEKPVIEGLEPFELIIAKDQPQYRPLRAIRSEAATGEVLSRWEISERAKQLVAKGADIFLELSTFHGPLQPIRLAVSTGANPEYFRSTYNLLPAPPSAPLKLDDLHKQAAEQIREDIGATAVPALSLGTRSEQEKSSATTSDAKAQSAGNEATGKSDLDPEVEMKKSLGID